MVLFSVVWLHNYFKLFDAHLFFYDKFGQSFTLPESRNWCFIGLTQFFRDICFGRKFVRLLNLSDKYSLKGFFFAQFTPLANLNDGMKWTIKNSKSYKTIASYFSPLEFHLLTQLFKFMFLHFSSSDSDQHGRLNAFFADLIDFRRRHFHIFVFIDALTVIVHVNRYRWIAYFLSNRWISDTICSIIMFQWRNWYFCDTRQCRKVNG